MGFLCVVFLSFHRFSWKETWPEKWFEQCWAWIGGCWWVHVLLYCMHAWWVQPVWLWLSSGRGLNLQHKGQQLGKGTGRNARQTWVESDCLISRNVFLVHLVGSLLWGVICSFVVRVESCDNFQGGGGATTHSVALVTVVPVVTIVFCC